MDTKKVLDDNQYHWELVVSAPKNFPCEYLDVAFMLNEDEGIGVFESPIVHEGMGIGSCSVGGNEDSKCNLPIGVEALWISFTNNKVYALSAELPIQQLTDLFDKGYSKYDSNGNLEHYNFETFDLCLLPNGKTVLYVKGLYKTVLLDWVGQATETNEFDEEIYDKYDVESIQEYVDYLKDEDEDFVVSSIDKNNAGLWDAYFQRYNYNLQFDFETNSKLESLICYFANGEYSNVDFDDHIIPFDNPSCLKYVKALWNSENCQYTAYFYFNEDEILRLFEKTYGENQTQDGSLNVFVGKNDNLFQISLTVGQNKYVLEKTEIRVFKDLHPESADDSELIYINYEGDHQNIFKGE